MTFLEPCDVILQLCSGLVANWYTCGI